MPLLHKTTHSLVRAALRSVTSSKSYRNQPDTEKSTLCPALHSCLLSSYGDEQPSRPHCIHPGLAPRVA